MYGFCRLGLSPTSVGRPARLRRERARDEDEHEAEERSRPPPRIGTVHGSTSATSRRLSRTAAEPSPVRTRTQSRSEPSWPLQKAVNAYAAAGRGSSGPRRSGTTRSSLRNAPSRTTDAAGRRRTPRRARSGPESARPAAARARPRSRRRGGVDRTEPERDDEGGATEARHALSAPRPAPTNSEGASWCCRRVLRRALRHERVLDADEGPARELAAQVDVPSGLEEVGDGAGVHDRRRCCWPVEVLEPEANPPSRASPVTGPVTTPASCTSLPV